MSTRRAPSGPLLELGPHAQSVRCDVTSAADWARAVEAHRRRLRRLRHAGQQRRHRDRQAAVRPDRGRVQPAHGHQRDGCVPRHEAFARCAGRVGQGLGGQHLVAGRHQRRTAVRLLCGVEVGRDPAHAQRPSCGRPASRQRGVPGLRRHRDGRPADTDGRSHRRRALQRAGGGQAAAPGHAEWPRWPPSSPPTPPAGPPETHYILDGGLSAGLL